MVQGGVDAGLSGDDMFSCQPDLVDCRGWTCVCQDNSGPYSLVNLLHNFSILLFVEYSNTFVSITCIN